MISVILVIIISLNLHVNNEMVFLLLQMKKIKKSEKLIKFVITHKLNIKFNCLLLEHGRKILSFNLNLKQKLNFKMSFCLKKIRGCIS